MRRQICQQTFMSILNSRCKSFDKHLHSIINWCSFFPKRLIEIPAYILAMVVVEKLGRKPMLIGGLISSGVGCLVTVFIPQGIHLNSIQSKWHLTASPFPILFYRLFGYSNSLLIGWQALHLVRYRNSVFLHLRTFPNINQECHDWPMLN